MMVCRAVALVAVLVATSSLFVAPAAAQFGGMPGLPGSGMPGMPNGGGGGIPGMPGAGGGFSAPPQAGPPPYCQDILNLRDETEKHGKAIQAANQRHASAQEACKLFNRFLATETRFIRAIEENGARCGAPPEVLKQVKAGHVKASKIGKEVCEVAAQGPRPTGPTLSDALGVSPTVPDGGGKKGAGSTFDTLTGNALTR